MVATFWAAPMLQSLLANELPAECLLRLWDTYIAKVDVRISLYILFIVSTKKSVVLIMCLNSTYINDIIYISLSSSSCVYHRASSFTSLYV